MDDYEDIARITASHCLVTYTCDVRPSVDAQQGLADWMANGHKWFALHATNAALDLAPPKPVEAPRCFPIFAQTLGSQFVAHPPIKPYKVEVIDPNHWFTTGIEPFETDDELYISEYHGENTPLLKTYFNGKCTGYAEVDWETDDPRIVAYTHPVGTGEVLYLNLGHCRSKYDMQPFIPEYPKRELGSWQVPQYHEMLRRGLRWATGT